MNATLAIASGKGGTGKTTVALNLAAVADQPVRLLDCDVEAPNDHLFIRPEQIEEHTSSVMIPAFDQELCDGCGRCKQHCRFNAIAVLGGKPMLFPELCHSCGACIPVCPHGAISEVQRPIGVVRRGTKDHISLVYGVLGIGEAKSPPLIGDVKNELRDGAGDGAGDWTGDEARGGLTIIDAPPGTSCPVVAAVKHCDYLLLVTEPTPFGLHDLKLAVGMAQALGLRHGVVINRCDLGDAQVRSFCIENHIPLLAELPFDRRVAEAYAAGKIPAMAVPDIAREYRRLYQRVGEVIVE